MYEVKTSNKMDTDHTNNSLFVEHHGIPHVLMINILRYDIAYVII